MKVILAIALMLGLVSSACATDYNNHQQQVFVNQKVVRFDARYFAGIPGYYSTTNQIKEERLAEDTNTLKAENQALRAQIELLIKLCQGGNVPKPEEPTTPPSKPEEPTPTVPEGGDKDNGEYQVTELDEQMHAILKESCAKCHSETAPKGDWGDGSPVLLFKKDIDTLMLQPLENRALMYEVVRRVGLEVKGLSPMPPGGPLADSKTEIFYQWMQEEATRIREK